MNYSARVKVMLKPGISDPQGKTIERALPALGYGGVANVRVGKSIVLDVDAADEADARRRVVEMCGRLLANPVLEDFEVTIDPGDGRT